ncbi:hypothetical protein HZY97_08195 [Sphingomonas sp. R-74633]|uniref:hypothetical protein n=1 Tax=Sphingomonas sp. R-74633 TaxID=2751188 RepID=UPI0015D31212|nr:hypothetical protein [Sphingomonas sp. R-74633]NYT40734.1 hypothetical protein [Sphingomonas sp. R-74633]
MTDRKIVAIGLLTQADLERLGNSFRDAIPINDDHIFADLLDRLDQIEVEPLGRGIVLMPPVKA